MDQPVEGEHGRPPLEDAAATADLFWVTSERLCACRKARMIGPSDGRNFCRRGKNQTVGTKRNHENQCLGMWLIAVPNAKARFSCSC